MMESWRSKTATIINNNNKTLARSKTNMAASCKKHPKHKQSPGVCSVCLNEKLFQINNGNSSRRRKVTKHAESSSVSDLSSLSSSNASSCASPVVHYARRMDSRDTLKFKKSKSMAFVLRTKDKEEERIKRGFWSKLLPRKKKAGLMHSKTTREKGGSLEFAAVVQIS